MSSEVFSELQKERAFPILTHEQITQLRPFGEVIEIRKDGMIWEPGIPNLCMFVVLEGQMGIQDPRTGQEIAIHGIGAFSGDIDVISGRPPIVQARAMTHMVLLEIPGEQVRHIVGEHPELGDIILGAFIARRAILQASNRAGIYILGSRYSPETLRIKEFLQRNRYPFIWDDVEVKEDVEKLLKEFRITEEETPFLWLPNGKQLRAPTLSQLAQELGLERPIDDKVYDLTIIGAGPAGLAAAVYGASEGLSTLVLDRDGPGGQAGTSSRIENYMGFPSGLSGQALADRAVNQAERFGAQFLVPIEVSGITCADNGVHKVRVVGRPDILTRAVILTPGAIYRKLDLDNLAEFENKGVYYSATNVERILCEQESVAVVGAGNSAGQAAVFMAERSAHVFLVVRGDDLCKTMSSYLARRIEVMDKITVLLNSEICALQGEHHLETATIVDRSTGQARTEALRGIFVMIGAVPRTDWLPEQIVCNDRGFVLTGQETVQAGLWKLERPPFFLETSCPGVFAAGDARCSSIKRVASAVGEGSMAVAFVHQYLAG